MIEQRRMREPSAKHNWRNLSLIKALLPEEDWAIKARLRPTVLRHLQQISS